MDVSDNTKRGKLSPDLISRMTVIANDLHLSNIQFPIKEASKEDTRKVAMWLRQLKKVNKMKSFKLRYLDAAPRGYSKRTLDQFSEDDASQLEAWISASEHVLGMHSYQNHLQKLRTKKHCARCHNQYKDELNERNSCQVPHVFGESDKYFLEEYQDENFIFHRIYNSVCCGYRVSVDVDDVNEDPSESLPCFEGKHTDDVDAVVCNGSNIQKCDIREGACHARRFAYERVLFWGDEDYDPKEVRRVEWY